MILGAHMSISKGLNKAVEDAVTELDCRAMQIFLKSPRGGVPKPLLQDQIDLYQKAYKEYNFEFVIGHSSYLLNLAKPVDFNDNWQMNSLLDDFQKLSHLHGKGLVYHVGKFLKLPYEEAEKHLVENLKILLDKAQKYQVPLLLENCAGQGTEMGTSLEQIKSVIDKVQAGNLLGVCIDTCHAYAAGYNLADPIEVENFFAQLDSVLGLDKVVSFHLNDSKTPLGSNKDRHENFNIGHIGAPGLKKFVELAVQNSKPLLIETPLLNNSHKTDIDIVKSWIQ
jgi:apurinic endonuclease APN1